MREDQIIPLLSCSTELMAQWKFADKDEVSELNILLNQIPKQYRDKYSKHIFFEKYCFNICSFNEFTND